MRSKPSWLRFLAVLAALVTLLGLPGTARASSAGEPRKLSWDKTSLRTLYLPPDGRYSYAPSVLRVGDTRWVWTCHNKDSRVIRDHIYLEKFVHGRLVADRSVLQATEGAWDSFHTCDPSVIAGRFGYGGERYGWAMFYLGNDLDASAHNQVGVAFAKSPDGPWVKYPQPIVRFGEIKQWGIGQPSAVGLGRSGHVMLFYTKGDTSTRAYWRRLDLTDMRKPVIGDPHQVSVAGLTGTAGAADYLNNYDMAYDPGRHAFLAVREQHPYPKDNPSWIGQSLSVDTISAADLRSGKGAWRPLNTVTPGLTGLDRNHNAGLERTPSGRLPDPRRPTVVFTSSCAGATCDSLYSYGLWQITGRIDR